MRTSSRTVRLTLAVTLFGFAAVCLAHWCGLTAGEVPARTAQITTPTPPVDVGPVDVPCPPAPCPPDPPTPVVRLRVRVPATVAAGQELEYRICVENASQAAAHHVLVRNPLPANARFVRAKPEPTTTAPEVQWDLGTLEPCACRELVLVLRPTDDKDVRNCARVQFEHGQCVVTRVARPDLSLRKSGPTQAVLFDELSYQLVVTNTGAAAAQNVRLVDELPDGLEHATGKSPLTWDLGTLAAGQSRRVDYRVIAKKAGQLCNRAAVTWDGGGRKEATACVTVGEAKLQLAMTGPKQRYVTRPATYQITVSNPGASPVANVVITDQLPENTTFVSASPGGMRVGNQVQWQVGTLPAGARRTVQVTLRAQAPGVVVHRASAAAARGLTAQAEATTQFEGATGLTVEIIDDESDPIEVGAQGVYTVSVRNQGNAPATKVVIVATVPDQMEVKGATGPTKATTEGQKVTYEAIDLKPGQEVVYDVTVQARAAGDVRFRVEMTSPDLPAGPVRREESITIYNP